MTARMFTSGFCSRSETLRSPSETKDLTRPMHPAALWLPENRRFEFQKRRQFFIRTRNETLSVVAMCVCNPQ
jgi:hypothetical protein